MSMAVTMFDLMVLYIFKDHNVKNIWDATCYNCTYIILITSKMIFIVVVQIFFQAIFEKKDRSYAFKFPDNCWFKYM
jgi:hypothetical protein